jgi:hypothetical protein
MNLAKTLLPVLCIFMLGSIASAEIDISNMKICRYKFPGSQGVIVQIPNNDPNAGNSYLQTSARNYPVSTGFIYGGLNIQWVQQDYFNLPVYFANYNSITGVLTDTSVVFGGVNASMINSKFVWGNKRFEASHCE